MNQSEFLASICSIAWGKSRVQDVIARFWFCWLWVEKLAQDLKAFYV